MTGASLSGLDPIFRLEMADRHIVGNHAQFTELLTTSERHTGSRNREAAAAAAAEAAAWAWLHHAGLHASPRLERRLRSLIPPGAPWTPAVARGAAPERVLHVLTQAYPTGGHTRWSDRIIQGDRTRSHSLVLVSQGHLPIPEWLQRSVAASGGEIIAFTSGGLFDRVAALRRLMLEADLVIANVHPHDVVAFLALADPRLRPPVVGLNHVDHRFWLGAGAWDLTAHLRSSGVDLAARRRGIPTAQSRILPLPLAGHERTHGRPQAKRLLGLRDDDLVLVSAGSAWKFDPDEVLGLPTFPEILAPIVARDPRIRLFVLGPANEGRWAEASRMTDGRLLAMGTRTDYLLFQQAADIYLDPFPMGSIYSMLEPGSLGVPLISLRQWPPAAATLYSEAPGLGDGWLVATTPEAYEQALLRLLASPTEREERGRLVAEQILEVHTGSRWNAALEELLQAAPAARLDRLSTSADLPPELNAPAFEVLDRGLAAITE